MVHKIYSEAESLIKKHKTRNPFEIADSIGIVILFRDLNNLKGFYTITNRTRYIVINQNLDDYLQKVICAHELGHDRFHRHFAAYNGLKDSILYDMSSRPERDANIFAADFLLSDHEVLLYAKMQGYSHNEIAHTMSVPPELMYFKTYSIYKRGYDIRTPEQVKSNFLRYD